MNNKINSKLKSIIKKGELLQNYRTKEIINPQELLSEKSESTKVRDGKKHWLKHFTLYGKIMNKHILDYGYCMMWCNYGLTKDNALNDEYLEILKASMSKTGVGDLLKRLVDNKMIARVKRGKYVLNPNIAHFGDGLDKAVYDLFK